MKFNTWGVNGRAKKGKNLDKTTRDPETNSKFAPESLDGWNINVLLGQKAYFQVRFVSFQGVYQLNGFKWGYGAPTNGLKNK